MQTLATKIPLDLYTSVLRKCAEKRCTPSAYVRELIEDDLDDDHLLKSVYEEEAPEVPKSEGMPKGQDNSQETYRIVKGSIRYQS